MANDVYFGQTAGQPANFPGTQQIIFEQEFRQRLRDPALITKITNSDWKGKFRSRGAQIEVPCLPLIKTNKRRPGDKVQYQDPKGWKETFTIDRERDVAFHVDVEDELFSPQNLESACNKEAQLQLAEDKDREFLADIYTKCHTANCGNTAGFRSEAYDLGTATAPAVLYKTDADVTGAHGVNATEFITSMVATLSEMPGGLNAKPFVVIPTVVAHRIQNSDLKKADWMGDAQSVLRKGLNYLGEIGGATIIECNTLPMWAATTGSGALPKRYCCLFGDTSAITYADEVVINDKVQDKDEYGYFYRTLSIYDWFVRYPERLGYGIAAIG